MNLKKISNKDIVMVISILVLPLLHYLHLFFPDKKNYDFFFFSFESRYYEDVSTMVWVTMIKLIAILTYSIWFVTCKHWWRFCILVPLIFSINQFLVAVNSELYYVDNNELLNSMLLSIPFIFILIYIAKKMNYWNEISDLKNNVDSEFENQLVYLSSLNKENLKRLIKNLENLKSNKDKFTEKEYAIELQKIKDKINL